MKERFKLQIFKNKKIALITIATLSLLSLAITFFFYQSNEKEIEAEEVEEVKEVYPVMTGSRENSPSLDVLSAASFYYSSDDNYKILYEENEKEVLPIASISKLMTAQVAFSNYNLNDPIGVKEHDIISRTEFRDFRAWEETEIEKMIYQMLIESNNSAAFALALISNRYINSDKDPVDAFVEEMNKKAKEIGLKNTIFVNPSGLDTKETYNSSTAEEIVAWSKYIINNNPELLEISVMPFYNLYSPDKTIHYTAINTNNFLHVIENDWQENIIGGKTGFTFSANGCLLIILKSPERNGYIINVVLGAEDRFKEMEKLINYIYQNYQF